MSLAGWYWVSAILLVLSMIFGFLADAYKKALKQEHKNRILLEDEVSALKKDRELLTIRLNKTRGALIGLKKKTNELTEELT